MFDIIIRYEKYAKSLAKSVHLKTNELILAKDNLNILKQQIEDSNRQLDQILTESYKTRHMDNL